MPFHGMSLRDAKRMWVTLGGWGGDKKNTGEEVYRHAHVTKPITVNKRRKDAPRRLTTALIWLWEKRPRLGTAV
ncbi:MAG: hypothetical protein V2A79_11215 [Planctomycetota bacterium]